MKNLSPREFAFVCSPLLIVAVIGFLMSRRKPPPPNAGKPHLVFTVEKTTTLEAFKGANATLTVKLAGEGTDKLYINSSNYSLELKSNSKTYNSAYSDGSSHFWGGVWKTNVNNSRFAINTRQIPPGKLRFKFTTQTSLSGMSTSTSTAPPYLSGNWSINRAFIKPLDFKQMPRAPLVMLRSVKVVKAASGNIDGECVFDLMGAQMGDHTPTDISFSGGVDTPTMSSGISWGTTASVAPSPNPMQRSWAWHVSPPPKVKTKLIANVSGRLSVEERWPLAFQIAPFDINKVKAGQSLHFQAGAAPIPTS